MFARAAPPTRVSHKPSHTLKQIKIRAPRCNARKNPLNDCASTYQRRLNADTQQVQKTHPVVIRKQHQPLPTSVTFSSQAPFPCSCQRPVFALFPVLHGHDLNLLTPFTNTCRPQFWTPSPPHPHTQLHKLLAISSQ